MITLGEGDLEMLCGDHCVNLTCMPLESNCGMILEGREMLNPPLCFLLFGVILALLEKFGFISRIKNRL